VRAGGDGSPVVAEMGIIGDSVCVGCDRRVWWGGVRLLDWDIRVGER